MLHQIGSVLTSGATIEKPKSFWLLTLCVWSTIFLPGNSSFSPIVLKFLKDVPWSGSAIIHCSSIHSFLHLETHLSNMERFLKLLGWPKVHSGSAIRSYTKTWINFLFNPIFLWWFYLYYFLSLLFLELLFKYYFCSTGPLVFESFHSRFPPPFFLAFQSLRTPLRNFIFQSFCEVSIFFHHCFNFWVILFSEYFFSK